jgi:hypothetical protein
VMSLIFVQLNQSRLKCIRSVYTTHRMDYQPSGRTRQPAGIGFLVHLFRPDYR